MRASLASLLAVALTSTITTAAPSIPGYTIETLQWEVQIAPGQTALLNGTIQEVYAQAVKLNPDFKPEPAAASTGATSARRGVAALKNKRTTVNCGNFALADKGRIEEGIAYLRNVQAAPRQGPGPAACGRVSCSYNAAIYWCNDNTTPKTLDNWNWIADSAQFIVNTCAPVANQVSGQNFESGNWNTIVRGDDC